MGITGLLPLLKSIQEKKHISKYKGMTVAVDGYCWLHRAMYSCSEELHASEKSEKYVKSFMNRVDLLLYHGLVPYIVFDGADLPAKAATESDREASREKNRALAKELIASGQRSEARKFSARATDVTAFMAYKVIQSLKKREIQFLVAPYEADAQLAFLSRENIVDAVISEDSDLIPYGCKKVLYKMDSDGNVIEFDRSKLERNQEISLTHFTDRMILDMCILAGCDYLPSLPGIGVKKAHFFLKKMSNVKHIVQRIQFEGKIRVPSDYLDRFTKARLTFLHQRIYNPKSKTAECLSPLPSDLEDSAFLGQDLDDKIAQEIATGLIDPTTKEPFSEDSIKRVAHANGATAFDVMMTNQEKEPKKVQEKENAAPKPREKATNKSSAYARLYQQGLKRRLESESTLREGKFNFQRYAFKPSE